MSEIEKRARELLKDLCAVPIREGEDGEIALIVAALTPPEGYVLVPVDPDCTELPNYIAGTWSRRNWEAALEDLTAARLEVP